MVARSAPYSKGTVVTMAAVAGSLLLALLAMSHAVMATNLDATQDYAAVKAGNLNLRA